MKIYEILTEAPKGLPSTIKPMKVPAFPQMPQQDGELGDGSSAGTSKDGGKFLKGAQGSFVWDKQGQPSKWRAPTFGGMTQTVDMKTGDITVRLQQGGLDVTGVYDKAGKLKQGEGNASYQAGNVGFSVDGQGNKSVRQSPAAQAALNRSESTKLENSNNKNLPHLKKLPGGKLELIGPGSLNPEDPEYDTPMSYGVFSDPKKAQVELRTLLKYFEELFSVPPSIQVKTN